MGGSEQAFYTACACNCGSKCILKLYVQGGAITRMGTDDAVPDDPINPQLRSCLRGRAWAQRVTSPERLRYPMKRVGPRGEGRFERISWEDAFDIYAATIGRVRERHGTEAIFSMDGSGTIGLALHNTWRGLGPRFLRLLGGGTEQTLSYSSGATTVAAPFTLGAVSNCSAPNFLETKLMLVWGWNPAEGGTGTNTAYFLRQARERGCRVYVVDPRYTDTAAAYADVWVPLRPGTDVALMSAMAWVIIREGLHDAGFLDRFTVGFGEWKEYLFGDLPKTPEWAAGITGVEAELIRQMAREYATANPAALVMGLGPQRTAYGEQVARCGPSLAALTGNIGIPGGYAGLMNWMLAFPSDGMASLPMPGKPAHTVPCNQWPDLLLKGRAGGYPVDVHMAIATGSNHLNQGGNLNKAARALAALDHFVVHELFMTPTARHADLVLPVTSIFERMDIAHANGATVFMPPVMERWYEAKSDWEIFGELGRRLGVDWDGGKSEEEWLRELAATSPVLPDWETFKRQQIVRHDLSRPIVGYREQVEQGKPFSTPSGKIEIASERLRAAGNPGMPPVPTFLMDWDSPLDEAAQRLPLQLITPHSKRRVHSSFHGTPWLHEVEPHGLWINPVDAAERGIGHGEVVRIFNDRGDVRVPAWVTERIRPGVVALPQGVWHEPTASGGAGADGAGSANVLTSDRPTPFAGATAQHTCLVEVERLALQGGGRRG